MSERDEFEAWRENCGYNTESIKGVLWMCWQAARAPQAVPALTEPVAWHIGNADGSINKIGAVYIRRSLAEKHIASYEGELDAQIVPLYAAPQPSPEKAAGQKLPRGGGQSFKSVNAAHVYVMVGQYRKGAPLDQMAQHHEHYWSYWTDSKTYKCCCGAERKDYPYGPADYKD